MQKKNGITILFFRNIALLGTRRFTKSGILIMKYTVLDINTMISFIFFLCQKGKNNLTYV